MPTFKKGTINIGERQLGRLKASSIIDCEPQKKSIISAIHRLYEPEFQEKLKLTINPYGNGGSSEKVVEILTNCSLQNILKKKFFDFDVVSNSHH